MNEPTKGHNIDGALNAFVERITDRENDKRAAMDDIKDICTEAKSAGFEPKVIKRIVRENMMDESAKAKRDAEDELYDIYRRSLRG